MHASDRHERALHVRVFALLDVEHAPPLHARRRRVRVAAGSRARLAPDAAAQIGDHGPASHVCAPTLAAVAGAMRTRTMSALDPVASVRSIDISVSEFMLGTPNPLVNGVAQ